MNTALSTVLRDTATKLYGAFYAQVEILCASAPEGWELCTVTFPEMQSWLRPPGEWPRPADRPYVRMRREETTITVEIVQP